MTFFSCQNGCKKVFWWGNSTNEAVKNLIEIVKGLPMESVLQRVLAKNFHLDQAPVVYSDVPFDSNGIEKSLCQIKIVDEQCISEDFPEEMLAIDMGFSQKSSQLSSNTPKSSKPKRTKNDYNPHHPEHFFDIPEMHLPDKLRHTFQMQSAYYVVNGSEPETTNVSASFSGCLDYIFCDDSLQPVEVFPVPSFEECKQKNYLPNESWPSDHLLLKARLHIK